MNRHDDQVKAIVVYHSNIGNIVACFEQSAESQSAMGNVLPFAEARADSRVVPIFQLETFDSLGRSLVKDCYSILMYVA